MFKDSLEGLVVAEVESRDEAAASDFEREKPDWFGCEVTEDPAYKNQQLALHGMSVIE